MEDKRYPFDSGFDDGVYGTGCTEPPKNHQAIIAVLLIAVIFLGGISTALSVLNIRLFQELHRTDDQAVAFSAAKQRLSAETSGPTAPLEADQSTVAIHAAPAQSGSSSGETMTLQEIYEKNIPSVVSITATTSGQKVTGTGVVLSSKGYLVTNDHVVEGAQSLQVHLTDERECSATLVGTDPVSDLAVLYIRADNLTEAQFGDSDSLRVGDSVVAIGDPLGVELRGTMTDGIVSAINRDVTVNGRSMNLIQTNAALNSGNSGGPLINSYGQVVGINTMKIGTFTDKSGVEGLGFAIPSATVKEVVNQIICQGYVSGRPWLGVTGESFSSFYQRFYQIPNGLYITRVEEGSPAEEAGLTPGDILTLVDGQPVSSMEDLNNLVYAHQVGETLQLRFYRSTGQENVTVTLTEKQR